MKKLTQLIFILSACSALLISACNKDSQKEKAVKGLHLFYTSEITDVQVDSVINYFALKGFTDTIQKRILITKSGENYLLKIEVKPGKEQDTGLCETVRLYSLSLTKNVFNGQPVDIHLCTTDFKTIKVIKGFGLMKKVGHTDVFYDREIPESEITSFCKYLTDSKFAEGAKKSVQLQKEGDKYAFRFVIQQSINPDSIRGLATEYCKQLSDSVFNHKKVDFYACYTNFITIRIIPFELGEKVTNNGTNIYYTSDISKTLVDSLGRFLNTSGFSDGSTKDLQITKIRGNSYEFRMVVDASAIKERKYLKVIDLFAEQLSKEVFDGSFVKILLCDNMFRPMFATDYFGGISTIYSGVQVFYSSKINEKQISTFVDYLNKSGFLGEKKAVIQLTKTGNTFVMKFPVIAGKENDDTYGSVVQKFCLELSANVFNHEPVDIHLCDEGMRTLTVIHQPLF